MAGLGRGGRGALLLKALETPVKLPGHSLQPQNNDQAPGGVKPPTQATEQAPPVVQPGVPASTSTAGPSRTPMMMGRGLLAQQLAMQMKRKSPSVADEAPPTQPAAAESSPAQSVSPVQSPPRVQPSKVPAPVEQPKNVSPPPKVSPNLPSDAKLQPSPPPVAEMERLEIKPKFHMEKGTVGAVCPMACNFIAFKTRTEGAYQYNVSYNPPIESKNMRFGMLNEHRNILGKTKAFDGATLFLPNRLPEPQMKLESKRITDNTTVELTITLVKVLDQTECIQLYNIVLRRVMKLLEMSQVGRYYYDPKRPCPIPQHRLELWPGYITAIQAYEGGVMLLADVSHKLLRTDTCLNFMYDIIHKHPNNYQSEVTKQLVGAVVLTRYNNKTYRIDDIAWDKNPESTFTSYTGEEMSYIDYYKKAYNKTLSDAGQPLLINRPKESKGPAKKGRQLEVICLIPELCSMTGLTDAIRADFRVMKDIAVHTRVTPNQRRQAMVKYIENIYSRPEALEELKSWNLELDRQLINLEGRTFPAEKIVMGSKTIVANEQADWGREATRETVISAVDLKNWMVISTKRDQQKALDFVQNMKQCCPQMGIKCNEPNSFAIKDDRTETYLRCIRENLNPQVQCVVCVFPTMRDDRYAAVKKLCCVESPVPSQMINAKTISQAQKLRSVTQKIALQINCKLGGELWALVIPMKNVMIVGIDVYHDASKGTRSIGGFVASTNPTFTRWYSRCCFQVPGQELIDGLKMCFTGALRKYHENNHCLPEKIIVFRDGVGDGQLNTVANYEVKQLQECFPLLGESYEPKLAVVVVQKRISQRIFAIQRTNLENPKPGSVLDHTITRKEWNDFFLVSQHVRQGTVTPTHYVIVHDETGMKADHFQRLAYKLTHLYYNWPGTIRVPAPCQYAHKLAFLVGQSLHKDPALELSDRLFFL